MTPTALLVTSLLSFTALSHVSAACTGNCYDFDDPKLCLGLYGPSGTCRCGLRDESADTVEEAEGTRPAREHEVTWAGGLYRQKLLSEPKYICSVSLLSPRTVITAAHCIKNTFTENSTLQVGLGQNSKTQTSQLIKVERAIPHPKFLGDVNNYSNDIAVLLLSEEVKLNDNVAPICISWDENPLQEIENNKPAMVASWDVESPDMQVYTMKLWSYVYCHKEVPPKFEKFVTDDKICSSKTGLTVGSGGAGLATKQSGHYYLKGINSIGTRDGEVNGYTRTAAHLDWLRLTLTSFQLSRPTNSQL